MNTCVHRVYRSRSQFKALADVESAKEKGGGLGASFGGPEALRPIWWALALGACLGGNGSLIGASANLAVAGIAERNGVPFGFLKFTLLAFPMMLASIAVAQLYLWLFFL